MFNVKAIANNIRTVLFIGVSSSCYPGRYGVDVVLTFKEVERGRRIASFHNFFLHTTTTGDVFKMKLTIAPYLFTFLVAFIARVIIIVPMCRRNDALACLHS